jgi:hypothetical protein
MKELISAAKAALSALETPGDLTEQEKSWVIQDLEYALRQLGEFKER